MYFIILGEFFGKYRGIIEINTFTIILLHFCRPINLFLFKIIFQKLLMSISQAFYKNPGLKQCTFLWSYFLSPLNRP
jgi:hypothetical protein